MEIFQDNNVLIDLGVWTCNLSSKGRVDVNAVVLRLWVHIK